MKCYFFLLILLMACSSSDSVPEIPEEAETDSLYFPPINGTSWEKTSLGELKWNANNYETLKSFLETHDTDAFILLKDGKIVIEDYFNGFGSTEMHLWNSAGKTLTAFTIGLAQQDGYLDINDKTTAYLGAGWTAMTPEQENAITLKNQLTMTSGGDYTVENRFCTDPECLTYLNAPGTYWYYHNAFYTLLKKVIDQAIPNGFDTYFESQLTQKIGMSGRWVELGYLSIYASDARSMARFGLLNLNKGNWNGTQLLNESFFDEMTNTSQNLNPAYGYLWWLNGKNTYRLPETTESFSGKLIPAAPNDLIAGLGANDQKLYVVPSQNLVIVRLGGAANDSLLGPSGFDDELGQKINAVMQ